MDAPFFREAGEGPGVVCVHSNASSSSQWRALMEMLAPSFHVLAPDTYGAGKSPAWPTDRTILLRDEVALLEPVFARACDPFALVGHSYGAAIALVAAATFPERVRCLVLYEPTLFALLEAESPRTSDGSGIREAAAKAAAAIDAGDTSLGAQHFLDYWTGEGTWASTPESRKPSIAASMVAVRGWAHALFGEPTPVADFARLGMPVLYIVGTQSPASSRGVARILTKALARVTVVELEMGHMGPITHAGAVNDVIEPFLVEHMLAT
jgi:pimeloyl-ACP methyl ester carboxylesterase